MSYNSPHYYSKQESHYDFYYPAQSRYLYRCARAIRRPKRSWEYIQSAGLFDSCP